MKKEISYMSGFANHFETQAMPATLPRGQNSPQKVAHGLYAEQISGSAFTAPRAMNLRSWLYRIKPSVGHSAFKILHHESFMGLDSGEDRFSPEQRRWDPLPIPNEKTDFIDGIHTWALSGDLKDQTGCAIHLYACSESMEDRFFQDSDAELLIVPQEGSLTLHTEFGVIACEPTEIAVIPRGVKFQVKLPQKKVRGYICENFGHPFTLPDLGPIGSNGLANPRDFLYPTAAFEDKSGKFECVVKYQGRLWRTELSSSPLDVVAWHGNYAPYKYDLKLFQVVNTVSFDHSDPSIFTVLTSPSERPGTANVDFVIFPPRWMVAEHTFRPPYFHRNIMSEFMGLIHGVYDAKEKGFLPGGSSLHNCMTSHGPEAAVFEKASAVELKPQYAGGTLAFMFESRYPFLPTNLALAHSTLQADYLSCWQGLQRHFSGDPSS